MEPGPAAAAGAGVKPGPGVTPAPGSGLCMWSWNVNGIRGSGFSHKLERSRSRSQIICLQETRVTRDCLDEPTAIIEGFNSYFSFCKTRGGYSGVATFCQDSATPFAAEEGLSGVLGHWSGEVGCYGKIQEEFSEQELRMLDSEGRSLITQHKISGRDEKEDILSVINVYCPRADPDREDRKLYKLRFCQLLQARAEALLQAGGQVVVLGDMNTSHRPIDQSDPMLEGFDLNPCRQWLTGFLSGRAEELGGEGGGEGGLFVDAFRHLHPGLGQAYTCWRNSTAARQTNFGSRIDYALVSRGLVERGLVSGCELEAEIHGSDHCPVRVALSCGVLPSPQRPALCTSRWPEFAGRQITLSRFLLPVRQAPASGSPGPARKRRDANATQPSLLRFLRVKAAGGGGEGGLGDAGGRREGADPSQGLAEPRRESQPQPQRESQPQPQPQRESQPQPQRESQPQPQPQRESQPQPQRESQPQPQPRRESEPQPQPRRESQPQAGVWRLLLPGLPPAPLCRGHREPCALRTVRKAGPRRGKQFYTCGRPQGAPSDPRSQCSTFLWVSGRGKPDPHPPP